MKSLGLIVAALAVAGCAASSSPGEPAKVPGEPAKVPGESAKVSFDPGPAPDVASAPGGVCRLETSTLDMDLVLRSDEWPGRELGRLWQGHIQIELRLEGSGLIPVLAEGHGRTIRAWTGQGDLTLYLTRGAGSEAQRVPVRFRAVEPDGRIRVAAVREHEEDQTQPAESVVDCASLGIEKPNPGGLPAKANWPKPVNGPAIRCPHPVTLYITAYPNGVEEYTKPIRVAELAPQTPFNAHYVVGPSGKPREPMRYLDDNGALSPVFLNQLDLGVTEKSLEGCENVPEAREP